MATKRIRTPVNIQVRFRGFNKIIRDIWESYRLVEFYFEIIQQDVRDKRARYFTLRTLYSSSDKTLGRDNTLGAISHLQSKANPRRVLIDAVSAFEGFLADLYRIVYEDFPEKLNGSEFKDIKLVQTILRSRNRAEIIDRLIEDKARALFYGNPTDFFLKSGTKLEIAAYFSEHGKMALEEYAEISARRNIVIHNGGRVDRKYRREVKGRNLKLKQVVPVDEEYLWRTLMLLDGLAAAAGAQVIQNVYKDAPRGKLLRSFRNLERAFVHSLPHNKPGRAGFTRR